MSKRRMLVTGATGETGGYTTERLLDEGFEVRALVHNADAHSDRLKSLGAEVTWPTQRPIWVRSIDSAGRSKWIRQALRCSLGGTR